MKLMKEENYRKKNISRSGLFLFFEWGRVSIRNPVMFEKIFPDSHIPDEWWLMIGAASDIDNPWIMHYEVR